MKTIHKGDNMQITVDTSKDSKNDIRKVIGMLRHILDEDDTPLQEQQNQPTEPNSSSEPSGYVNMFAPNEGNETKPGTSVPTNTDIPQNVPLSEAVEGQTISQPEEPKEEQTNNGIRIIEY